MTHGEQAGNQNATKNEVDNMSGSFSKRETRDGTAGRIGKEYGVDGRTIRRDAEYAKGVDAIEKDSPGMEHKLLVGEVRITKATDAIVWICKTSLDMTEQGKMYLLGKQYEARKMTHGGDRKSSGQSDHLKKEPNFRGNSQGISHRAQHRQNRLELRQG